MKREVAIIFGAVALVGSLALSHFTDASDWAAGVFGIAGAGLMLYGFLKGNDENEN